MAGIAVPQTDLLPVVGRARLGRGVGVPQNGGVVLLLLLEIVGDADEILGVGLKAQLLLLPLPPGRVAQVQKRPNHAQQGRGHRRHQPGIHVYAAAAPAPAVDGQHTPQQHGDGHGERRADGQQERTLLPGPEGGRRFNLQELLAHPGQVAGGAAEIARFFLPAGRRGAGEGRPHRAQVLPVDAHPRPAAAHRQHAPQKDNLHAEDVDALSKAEHPAGAHPLQADVGAVGAGVLQHPALPPPQQAGVVGRHQPQAVDTDDVLFRLADGHLREAFQAEFLKYLQRLFHPGDRHRHQPRALRTQAHNIPRRQGPAEAVLLPPQQAIVLTAPDAPLAVHALQVQFQVLLQLVAGPVQTDGHRHVVLGGEEHLLKGRAGIKSQ